MKRIQALTLAIASSLLLVTATAASPIRVRGTIVADSPDTVTVHTTSGNVLVALKNNTAFVSVVSSNIGQVETGGYVGIAAKTVSGKLIALSVIVFPPAMRGAAEGHADYDILPDTTVSGGGRTASTMTNANVKAISPHRSAARVNSTMTNGNVATAGGSGGFKLLTVTYKGGQQDILVPPTAPIVAFVPGSESIVKPGAAVFVNGDTTDGKVTAGLVAVGSHGIAPPF